MKRAVIDQVERIARAAQLDVGGIELLVDDRDGRHYFYDVNALSNFVADAENVIGFDPFVNLVDYLAWRVERGAWRDFSATSNAPTGALPQSTRHASRATRHAEV